MSAGQERRHDAQGATAVALGLGGDAGQCDSALNDDDYNNDHHDDNDDDCYHDGDDDDDGGRA